MGDFPVWCHVDIGVVFSADVLGRSIVLTIKEVVDERDVPMVS